MKIEIKVVKKKVKKTPVLYFEDVPDGTVYDAGEGIVILRVDGDNGVVLCGWAGSGYLAMAIGYKKYPVVKILGHLSGVEVTE